MKNLTHVVKMTFHDFHHQEKMLSKNLGDKVLKIKDLSWEFLGFLFGFFGALHFSCRCCFYGEIFHTKL